MSYFEEGDIIEEDAFERTDLTQHRKYLDKMVAAWRTGDQSKVAVGSVTVITGDILTIGTHKGRGKEELADERGFRKVATQMGVGIRITHRHLPDGKTMIRMSPQEKKVFSDEAIAKRTAALEKRRERLAVEKFAKEHNKLVTQLTREEAQGAVATYRASKTVAPATKATKKAS